MHTPVGAERGERALHQRPIAEGIARPVDAQHGLLDGRQMSRAKLLRLTRWMEWIREQQQAVARHPFRDGDRRRAAPHRAAPEQQTIGTYIRPYPRHHRREAPNELRHGIRATRPPRPVHEIESDDADAAIAKRGAQAEDRSVAHMTAGAVSAHEHRARIVRGGRIPLGNRLVRADCNAPLFRRGGHRERLTHSSFKTYASTPTVA